MTSPIEHDDVFEQLLRDSGPDPVPDQGFVDATMALLPPGRRRRRWSLIWPSFATGMGIATWQLHDSALLAPLFQPVTSGLWPHNLSLLLVAVISVLLCFSAALLSDA